jgi:hypothetical protein
MSIVIGNKIAVPFAINEVDTLAGTSFEGVAPVDGFINAVYVVVQKLVTTGGTVKVAVGAVDVVGAVVTVANSAAKGVVYSAQSTKYSPTRAINKGDRYQVIPDAAFATAGAVSGFVEFSTGG